MLKRLLMAAATLLGALTMGIAALLVWPVPDMPRQGVAGNFVIRNVAVVDVENGALLRNRDVIVRDGLIASVEPDSAGTAGDPVIVIDGTGKYLMPGLWDMHTHSIKLSSQYHHPLFIANGVTAVRELWGCMSEPDSFFACTEDRRSWNEALADGTGLSPRYMRHSSFHIDGGNEVPDGFPEFFKARDAGEARRLVAYYHEAGADILKIYSGLSVEAYETIAEDARRRGLSLEGHRPLRVSLEEMLAAGQRSVEHPRLFLFECFAGAAEFRALPDPYSAYTPALRKRLVDEHDEERCETLMDAMARSDTWWTPTLQVLKSSALADDDAYRTDSRLKYIPYLFRRFMWTPDLERKVADGTDESGRNIYAAMYALALKHVRKAHESGVKILTGTDAGDSHVFPGFSVHDELAELVAAGLSPAAALRTATIDAAVFSGEETRFGSIATGKTADMILLDANPLEDIRNTQRIRGLFFNGRFYDRPALDRLLAFAARRAGSARTNLNILWDALNSPLLRVQLAD